MQITPPVYEIPGEGWMAELHRVHETGGPANQTELLWKYGPYQSQEEAQQAARFEAELLRGGQVGRGRAPGRE